MKVALIIDTWFPHMGGGQISAFEITKRIAKDGAQIDIITRNNGNDDLKPNKNLNVYKLGKQSAPYNTISKLIFIFNAFFFVIKRDYNLINIHAFLPGLLAIPLSFTCKTPVIFTVHGTSIGTNLNSPLKSWLEKFILTKIYYTAQITVSRDFLKIKNVNKKIFYIPNGVNVESFDEIKVTKAKTPTLIYVGRLHHEKNIENLILAITEVKKEIPDIKLLIVGNGPEEQKLKKLTNNLELTDTVTFLGQVTGQELIKLYKTSHIFILPSIYEGQPLTLLEAWAAKIPVITTKTGDSQYLVKDGINGYLIENPPGEEQITQTIKRAFRENKLAKIGDNGHDFIKDEFTWSNSAAKTLSIYKKFTNG